jgi:enoyl-[acyl-carrier protein] reductase I
MSIKGLNAVVIGIANERSLAYSIAKSLSDGGANLALNYLNEKLESRVRPIAEELGAKLVEKLDANDEASIKDFFSKVEKQFGKVDILIHSIAFANREDLEGRFIDTSRQGFLTAMDISAFSLVRLAKECEPLMTEGGAILTLSYLGAQRVVPNYNVMGVAKAALEACVRYLAVDMGPKKIRVNAISAGPVKTLSAAGIRDFRKMLADSEEKTPLKENITGESVGAMAAFLSGPGGRHITGETIFIDSGSHIL